VEHGESAYCAHADQYTQPAFTAHLYRPLTLSFFQRIVDDRTFSSSQAFVALATDLTARTVATVAGQATATGRLDNIEEAAETMASRMQATGLALTSTMNVR